MYSPLSYGCLRVCDYHYYSGFSNPTNFLGSNLFRPCKSGVQAFARRKSMKKPVNGRNPDSDVSIGNAKHLSEESSESEERVILMPSRDTVLQACLVTSGLMAALAVMIRQVSHIASLEGLPIPDCSVQASFDFEISHLQLTTGLVILISSCRYLLLKSWPDFAESSEAANQQVLSSLKPSDYLIVSILPGISEELLFRGALLPLFGFDWKSIVVVSVIFGFLHLGSGRKYSFGIWATLVGVAYGCATVISSSLSVAVASHALNNLAGGMLWRYTSKSLK